MTMHLVRGLSTTSTRKRKKKVSPRRAEANKRHEDYLRSMGVHPEQLAKKKADRKPQKLQRDTSSASKMPEVNPESMRGVAAKKDPMVYSGERKLLGIATMHKSNMVPVFDKGSAEDYAKMRRN